MGITITVHKIKEQARERKRMVMFTEDGVIVFSIVCVWVRVFHSIQSHRLKGQTKTVHNQQLISYMLSWQEFSQAHSTLKTETQPG
jgi:glycopeptide antibiotics resistance protein